jgi:hypothetical protein
MTTNIITEKITNSGEREKLFRAKAEELHS